MPGSPVTKVMEQLRNTLLLRDGGGLSDGQLLDRYIEARQEAAFEALVRRHGPMVWGVCRRIVGRTDDAEDAFQATFLVLVRKAASILPREAVGNWLYGVACHTALKARAVSAKMRAKEKQVMVMPEPAAGQGDPWEELLPLLDQELRRLPDRFRLPVVLCDLEGRSRKDVASQLKIPEGTLSSRLATARKTLAKRLAGRGLAISGGVLAGILTEKATACVPASVVSATIKSATLVAVGQAGAAGAASAKVTALAEGVLKTMLLTRLKMLAVVMAFLVMLGVGILTSGMLASGQVIGKALAKQGVVQEKPTTPLDKNPTGPQGEQIDDSKTLQGEWRAVEFEREGEKLAEAIKELRVTITGDAILIRDLVSPDGKKSTFKLASNYSPKRIDITPDYGVFKGQQLAGIYALEKGRLRICIIDRADRQRDVKNRPKEFETEAGDGLGLLNLERAKPKNADPKKEPGQQPQGKQKESGTASKELDPKVVEAWQKAGAEVGWYGQDDFGGGFWGFSKAKLQDPAALPAFRAAIFEPGAIAKLPAPSEPFALVLNQPWMTDAGPKALAGLKYLHTLDLRTTELTDAGLKGLASLKTLQHLNLSNTELTDAGLKELTGLKGLQTLDISRTKVLDAGLKELAGLKSMQNLDLSFTKVTDAGLKQLGGLKSLQTLNLGVTGVADAGLKELAGLKNLQTLRLNSTMVTDAGLKELAGFENLQSLVLVDTNVSDAGLKELAGLKILQNLYLDNTKVTDAGLKELAGLKNMQNLYLGLTRVTDAGLKELSGFKILERLNLRGTQVTDAALKDLAGLKSLQYVDLGQTGFTDAGVAQLRKARPKLIIDR